MFSSGKNLEAIAVMVLVDRGLVRYEDAVAEHWPAFAQHGKARITIEDVLRHEARRFATAPAACCHGRSHTTGRDRSLRGLAAP